MQKIPLSKKIRLVRLLPSASGKMPLNLQCTSIGIEDFCIVIAHFIGSSERLVLSCRPTGNI